MANKRVYCARSKQNGIVFYSQRFPKYCYEVLCVDDKTIQSSVESCKSVNKKDCKEMQLRKAYEKRKRIVLIIRVICLIIIMLKFSISSIDFAVLFFNMTTLDIFMRSCINSYNLKIGKFKEMAKYHAAEHMVVNAYETLQRVPNISELKTFSRFSSRCKDVTEFNNIIFLTLESVVIGSFSFVEIWLFILIQIVAIFIMFVLKKLCIVKYLEFLVTTPPTKKELSVAICGIALYDTMENMKNHQE